LEPQREALLGRLGAQTGGVATPESGLFQEILRRQERDFGDQLVSQGFQNLLQATGQGAALGGQQFGQGMANVEALQRSRELQAQLAQQANLANLQASLESQRLGTTTGLQGLGLAGDLAQQDLQRLLQGQELGLRGTGLVRDLAQQDIQRLLQGQELGLRGTDLARNIQLQALEDQIRRATELGRIGQQRVGAATDVFRAIPAGVAPFAQLSGQLPIDLGRLALDAAGLAGRLPLEGGRLGLEAATGISGQNLSALDRALRQQELIQSGLFDRLRTGQEFLGGQQRFGLEQTQQVGDLTRALMDQLTRLYASDAELRAATRGAKGGAIGDIIGSLVGALGSIFRRGG